jgi:hypothetical protein
LDPTDVEKWLKLTSFAKQVAGDDEDEEGDDEDEELEESNKHHKNRKGMELLRETRLKRLREITERYKDAKSDIFMQFLESQHMSDFVWRSESQNNSKHYYNVPPIRENDANFEAYKKMSGTKKLKNKKGYNKLQETLAMNAALRVNSPKEVETIDIKQAMKLAAAKFKENEENHNVITSYGDND